MKNITETQLAIQRELNSSCEPSMTLMQKFKPLTLSNLQQIETLEQQLREEVKERSLF